MYIQRFGFHTTPTLGADEMDISPAFEYALSKGVVPMKYRILGIIAGLLTIFAQLMPYEVRRFILYKVKNFMYLVFG